MAHSTRVVAVSLLLCITLWSAVQGFSRESELVASEKEDWVDRLYRDKMAKYNKQVRPVTDHSRNTTVLLGLSLNRIDLDDKRQELSVNAWTIMTWTDEYLQWSPEDYMNTESLHFDDEDIWLPDITLYNSADATDVHPFGNIPVLATHMGQMYWFPPTHLVVHCDLNLSNWPRDQHECTVRLGSWAHHGEQIDMQLMQGTTSEGIMKDNFEPNSRWTLVSEKGCRSLTSLEGHDTYVEINFTFTIQRNSETHASYILQSSVAIMIMVLATYLLPLNYFLCRLVMHLCALSVLIGCYFTLFAELPAQGGEVPFVVRYYAGSILLTTMSMVTTILLTSCCCCFSSSSNLGRRLVVAVNSAPIINRFVSSEQQYNNLETVMMEEEIGPQVQPHLAQEDKSSITGHQVRVIINFLMALLYCIAFIVDFMALKSVAY